MARRVEVVPYDPGWADTYAIEAALLTPILGRNLIALHHVGSTAVPGLMAKPTVDLLAVVRDFVPLDALNESLQSLGYEPRGENGIPGRRYFRKCAGERHLCHLHAYEIGNPDITGYLDFRDFLRAYPEAARAYQELKLELAARFASDPPRYTAEKADFIQGILRKASLWRKTRQGG